VLLLAYVLYCIFIRTSPLRLTTMFYGVIDTPVYIYVSLAKQGHRQIETRHVA